MCTRTVFESSTTDVLVLQCTKFRTSIYVFAIVVVHVLIVVVHVLVPHLLPAFEGALFTTKI